MSRQCRDKDRHAGARAAGRWLWIARSRLCSLGLASCVSLVLAFAAVFFAMAGTMPEEDVPVKLFGDGRSLYSCQEAHIPFSAASSDQASPKVAHALPRPQKSRAYNAAFGSVARSWEALS